MQFEILDISKCCYDAYETDDIRSNAKGKRFFSWCTKCWGFWANEYIWRICFVSSEAAYTNSLLILPSQVVCISMSNYYFSWHPNENCTTNKHIHTKRRLSAGRTCFQFINSPIDKLLQIEMYIATSVCYLYFFLFCYWIRNVCNGLLFAPYCCCCQIILNMETHFMHSIGKYANRQPEARRILCILCIWQIGASRQPKKVVYMALKEIATPTPKSMLFACMCLCVMRSYWACIELFE